MDSSFILLVDGFAVLIILVILGAYARDIPAVRGMVKDSVYKQWGLIFCMIYSLLLIAAVSVSMVSKILY